MTVELRSTLVLLTSSSNALNLVYKGAGRSSEVERSLVVQWGGPIELLLSFQPVLHDWFKKGRGMLSCLWDGILSVGWCI